MLDVTIVYLSDMLEDDLSENQMPLKAVDRKGNGEK